SIDMPPQWETVNEAQAVGAASPGQDAVVQVSLCQRDTPAAAAQEFFGQQGIQAGEAWRDRIGGQPTVARAFRATDERGTALVGIAAFVEHRGHVYQLLGISMEGAWDERGSAIESSLASFRDLT